MYLWEAFLKQAGIEAGGRAECGVSQDMVEIREEMLTCWQRCHSRGRAVCCTQFITLAVGHWDWGGNLISHQRLATGGVCAQTYPTPGRLGSVFAPCEGTILGWKRAVGVETQQMARVNQSYWQPRHSSGLIPLSRPSLIHQSGCVCVGVYVCVLFSFECVLGYVLL